MKKVPHKKERFQEQNLEAFFLVWYNSAMNNTKIYYSPKQGRLPLFITDILDICDPVLTFDRIMEEIEIEKYLKPEHSNKLGRPGYNRVNMLKSVYHHGKIVTVMCPTMEIILRELFGNMGFRRVSFRQDALDFFQIFM